MIIKDGVCAFHRSYGDMSFDNIQLVGGFFHALLTFSTQLGEGVLDSIKFSNVNLFFKTFQGFTFVFGISLDITISQEQVESILNKLAKNFHETFPSASTWHGELTEFDAFAVLCDTVLQVQPSRKGFPLLLKVALKPFLIGPALQILFIKSEDAAHFYEFKRHLEQISEKLGHKKLKSLLKQPNLLYLPNSQYLVYLIGFNYKSKKGDLSHLLCFFMKEKDWFMFYQLNTIIYNITQQLLPSISNYLQKYEANPTSDEIVKLTPYVQDAVENWADLNQYIGSVQASLFEEYYKSGITADVLTEEQARIQFNNLISLIEEDIDKVIFALLTQKQTVFVGESRKQVEEMIGTILNFYPHPSVKFWAEMPGEYLIVGTHPINTVNFKKSSVFVDLVKNQVTGGEKNAFCSDLMKKTIQLAEVESISEARVFFQGKISNVFSLLKTFLDILSKSETQTKQLEKLLPLYSPAALELIAKMSENLNTLLAKTLKHSKSVRDVIGLMGMGTK